MSRPVFEDEDELLPSNPMEFGRYQLRGQLGRGAMGRVFRAYDSEWQREVALKLLPSSAFVTSADLARFKREAQLAAGIDHPNVVTLFEAGEIDDQPFLAMQLVVGGSLLEYEDNLEGDLQNIAILMS